MKKIFFIAAIATFSFASAQNNNQAPWIKPLPPKPKTNSLEQPRYYVFNAPNQLIAKARLLNELPNGNKVYGLPQDNMPCIVPDASQYNMPVVKPDVTYTIPNPALPSAPAKPMILTQEQLEKLIEMQKQQHK